MDRQYLHNGCTIPSIGLGTWQIPQETIVAAVNTAIDSGYKHIDCAFVYGNESSVGIGLKNQLVENNFPRHRLFVTSKLWCTFHRKEKVRENCIRSLSALNLEYIDLYLIHWPVSMKPGNDVFPVLPNGDPDYDTTNLEETWAGMEQLVRGGLARSIGLSNFNKAQIHRILECCDIPPAMLQVESHPYFLNEKLIHFAKGSGMHVTAYAPLGSTWNAPEAGDTLHLLDHPVVKDMAEAYAKSPAQVLIRFALQRGLIVLPKSVSPDRIRENIKVFDFDLLPEDMDRLKGLNRNQRFINPPRMLKHPQYPFVDEF